MPFSFILFTTHQWFWSIFLVIQLLEWRSLSRASNSHSHISSSESSSLNLSSSIPICDLPVIEGELISPSCLCLLAMEGGEGVMEVTWLDGVSDLAVVLSSSSFGLSIDSNSPFIFSMASNSSATLSMSFLYQNCKCIGKHHLHVC